MIHRSGQTPFRQPDTPEPWRSDHDRSYTTTWGTTGIDAMAKTPDRSDETDRLPERDLARLMALLSRKGARAHLPADAMLTDTLPDADCGHVVILKGSDRGHCYGRAAHAALAEAKRQGWVAPAREEAAWQLSQQGRVALKRLRSRTDKDTSPPPAGHTPPAPSRLPAPPRAPQAKPAVNDMESPLAWLRRRKDKAGQPLIDAAQFQAGERLRADYEFANLMPSVTSRWSPVGSGGSGRRQPPGSGAELRDDVLAARERVHRALGTVGPELAGILLDVCCHLKGLEAAERDQGWPLRSAKVVLQLALTRLARHYGLASPPADDGPQPATKASRILHWGTSDYRPTTESWHD